MAVEDNARRDLIEKLRLERIFAAKINKFNSATVRRVARDFAASGVAANVSATQPELEQLLNEHYQLTAETFAGQLANDIPEDLKPTDDERAAIAAALVLFFLKRSKEQAGIITSTTQNNVSESVTIANDLAQNDADQGRPQSREEVALVAAAILSRRLRGRTAGIATTETQAAAETSKTTEAQILAGQPPSVSGGSPRVASIIKTWVTVGDERVRPAHMNADNQAQDINSPFNVGGEQLMYPGDTSLGASVGNVINCRCSSVIDQSNFLAIRRKIKQEPVVDRTASDGLLASMGE